MIGKKNNKIIRRNKLRRSGFAGLRETRLVMSPRIFRGQQEAGTSAGLGKCAYRADADHIGLGKVTRGTMSTGKVLKKAQINIQLLICRAVKWANCR